MDPIVTAALIGGGIGLFGIGSNRQQQNQATQMQHAQFQASHKLAEDQLYRGAQIKRADLEAAGLHPTLAAGNSGHTPLPSGTAQRPPNQDYGSIVHSAMMAAQVKQAEAQARLLDAEATRTETETEHIPKRFKLAQDDHTWVHAPLTKIAQDRDEREAEMHKINKNIRRLEHDMIKLNLKGEQQRQSLVAIDKAMREFERDYIKTHGLRMPTDDALLRSMQKHLTQVGMTTYLAGKVANEALKPVSEILNLRLRHKAKPATPKRTSDSYHRTRTDRHGKVTGEEYGTRTYDYD